MSLSLFFAPYNQSNLQSESLSRRALDQFDELNPAADSVCPWDCWFQLHKQKHSQIPAAKISAKQTSPPSITITTTVRRFVRGAAQAYFTRRIQSRCPISHRTAGCGSAGGNISNFRFSELYPKKLHPPPSPSPSTIRTHRKAVSAPFKHAVSNGNLHLSPRLIVVGL